MAASVSDSINLVVIVGVVVGTTVLRWEFLVYEGDDFHTYDTSLLSTWGVTEPVLRSPLEPRSRVRLRKGELKLYISHLPSDTENQETFRAGSLFRTTPTPHADQLPGRSTSSYSPFQAESHFLSERPSYSSFSKICCSLFSPLDTYHLVRHKFFFPSSRREGSALSASTVGDSTIVACVATLYPTVLLRRPQ